MTTGLIFDIQRFSIQDGPGIRTTVFLKGCDLGCIWCHNPEGLCKQREIFFSSAKCIQCRACAAACKYGCHRFTDGHVYLREQCAQCGLCAMACCSRALETVGREITVAGAIEEIMKDADFYNTSGGGITLSGGEPMMQFEFAYQLLQEAKENNLHTCMETSGYAPYPLYEKIRWLVDLFLYDIKETDPLLHRRYTGASNQMILDNLSALDQAGSETILRCPIIPGLNDRSEHFRNIARLADRMHHVQAIHVLPYHPLGNSKNVRLGKTPAYDETGIPGQTVVEQWMRNIQDGTKVKVLRP